MGQGRLNHLMVLNICKEDLDNLDINDIANQQSNEHRLQIFGTLTRQILLLLYFAIVIS